MTHTISSTRRKKRSRRRSRVPGDAKLSGTFSNGFGRSHEFDQEQRSRVRRARAARFWIRKAKGFGGSSCRRRREGSRGRLDGARRRALQRVRNGGHSTTLCYPRLV